MLRQETQRRSRRAVDVETAHWRHVALLDDHIWRSLVGGVRIHPKHAEPLAAGIGRTADRRRNGEVGLRRDKAPLSMGIVLPAMIEAGDPIAAHEAEAKPHAAMGTEILPGARGPVGVAAVAKLPVE